MIGTWHTIIYKFWKNQQHFAGQVTIKTLVRELRALENKIISIFWGDQLTDNYFDPYNKLETIRHNMNCILNLVMLAC